MNVLQNRYDARAVLARCTVAVVAMVGAAMGSSASAAKLEQLAPDRYMLVGAIDARDLAPVQAVPEGALLQIFAWGHSEEAWWTITQMSDSLAGRSVKVQIEYGEDAAAAITGSETVIAGRVRFDDKIPSFDTTWLQKVATTIDRMRHLCEAKIPDEAPERDVIHLVGERVNLPETRTRRGERNQRWQYLRMSKTDKGRWVLDDESKVRREEETARKQAKSKADGIKRNFDDKQRKDEQKKARQNPTTPPASDPPKDSGGDSRKEGQKGDQKEGGAGG